MLLERLPTRRAAGALVIVAGLVVIGAEAIATIGAVPNLRQMGRSNHGKKK